MDRTEEEMAATLTDVEMEELAMALDMALGELAEGVAKDACKMARELLEGVSAGDVFDTLGERVQADLQEAMEGVLDARGEEARAEGMGLSDFAWHAGSAMASCAANLGADPTVLAGELGASFTEGFADKGAFLARQEAQAGKGPAH